MNLKKPLTYVLSSFLLLGMVILFSGVFVSVIVGLLIEDFSYELMRVSIINSLFFALGIVVNVILLSFVFSTTHIAKTLIINTLVTIGLLIIDYFYLLFTEPVFLIVYQNVFYLYMLINFAFIQTISLVMTIFMMMSNEIKMKDQAIEMEKRHFIEAKLEQLTERINPHFLFNSLNTAIALLPHKDKAEDFLTNLSELLRYNVTISGKKNHTIRDEIEYVKKFLYIQKIRFEERLEYQITGTSEYIIPPMIIQILVENSIKHTINFSDPLRIDVIVTENNDMISIEVKDSYRLLQNDMIGKGSGLQNCSTRVMLAGGSFIIENGAVRMVFYKSGHNQIVRSHE